MRDFAVDLKKKLAQAYPSEPLTSAVLLQKFVICLQPTLRRYLLLKGQPDNLTDATDQATKIEFALEFGDDKAPATETTEVFTVKQPTPSQGVSERSDKLEQLEWKLDEMAKRFEKLETQLDRGSGAGRFSGGRRPPP